MAHVTAGCDYSEFVYSACIFVYGIFSVACSNSDCVALNDRVVNVKEWEGIAYLDVTEEELV